MKGDKISIKWKIALYLIGYCSILIMILWLFQTVFLDSFYKNIKVSGIKTISQAVINHWNTEDFQKVIDQASKDKDMCVEILTPKGMQLYISHFEGDNILHRMQVNQKVALFKETQENGGALLQYYALAEFNRHKDGEFEGHQNELNQDDYDSIIYSRIITDQNNEQKLFLFNGVVLPIDATVKTIRVQLYYITAIMIACSLLLAFAIAKWISRPIVQINQASKELAQGNYNVAFEGRGYKEISELADTLNYTSLELSKVESLQRDLIANISHDLRTPLTLMTGYSEAMRDLPDENTPENLQLIIDETKRLTALVNDLLDLSKMQAGVQKLNLSTFSLTKNTQETLQRFSKLSEQKGFSFVFNFNEDIQVTADELRISQVLYNFITNAINHCGVDKTVCVQQILTPGTVRIEITDTGCGIDDDQLPYIWDRYYKTEKSHKKMVPGNGLGLAIVKSILELHNGAKVGVRSEQGVGCTFWFSLEV